MKTKLYVIRMNGMYWTCSSEHGTGWMDTPKQSFSPSELTKEIRRLIDENWMPGHVEIVRLHLAEEALP